MIFGMTILTFVHVLLSLVGILAGFVVMSGFLAAKQIHGWTTVFIWTTVATSVTGFLFPFHKLLPSHVLGILSLVALAVAIVARYARQMAGTWRSIYVVSAVLALYFNVFVLVAQTFLKVPAAHALAPTGKEPPFLVVQLIVMAIFIVLGILAVKRFRIDATTAPAWKNSRAS